MEDNKDKKCKLWITLGSPAFHLDAVKRFFTAQLEAYKAYLQMNLEVYGDTKAIELIERCDKSIAAVNKVTNGETFSKEVLRNLRWTTTMDDLLKCGESILSSCNPRILESWDEYYTELKKDIERRRLEDSKKEKV